MNKRAVIIPNYNGESFIVNTVNVFLSFFNDYEIVVVDDCSTDRSVDLLNELDCVLIKRKANGGFAAAINSGFQYLIENNFYYALVANSDLDINSSDARKVFESLDILDSDLNVAVLGYCESGTLYCSINEDISGFLFALRLSVIRDIGYFDETFYMYGEEQDYFRRVISSGFTIYQTNICINHRKEGSGGGSLKSSWFAMRNALYLEAKQRLWWKMFRVFANLLLTINRIYYPSGYQHNPSYQRIVRPGILKANYYLFNALIWNFKFLYFRKK